MVKAGTLFRYNPKKHQQSQHQQLHNQGGGADMATVERASGGITNPIDVGIPDMNFCKSTETKSASLQQRDQRTYYKGAITQYRGRVSH